MTEQTTSPPDHQDHDHGHHDHGLLDRGITRGFIVAIGLTAITLIAELVGGFWTNSLALLSVELVLLLFMF